MAPVVHAVAGNQALLMNADEFAALPDPIKRAAAPFAANGGHRGATRASGRILPHSLEAEEFLLSCCLLDGEDVVSRCTAARIKPGSFYDSKHGIIFERLADLHARKIPIDIAVLAEELKVSRELEAVGGYAFLTQVSSRIPTTAQASYFIEKVREQALLREIIRSATGTVEDCYGFTGGIDEFVSQAAERMTAIAEYGTSTDAIMARLDESRYDPKRRLPDLAPVFLMGKVAIFTRGNLGTITAQSKSGKSSVLAGILAATFKDPYHGGDTFKITGLNPDGKALIHFDTEQHGKHHEKLADAVLRRAGVSDIPDWFYSYTRKGVSPAQLRLEFEACLKSKSNKHNGIHSAHIDGIADFCLDVNDPKDVNPLVTWLEGLAVKYDCSIICVLHLNPVGKNDSIQKARGHLGSQLQRKCETDLRLKKDADGVTTVFTDPSGTRGEPVFEKDGPTFKWDQDAQMHMSCGSKSNPKAEAKREKLEHLVDAVFTHSHKTTLSYSDFTKALSDVAHISADHACTRFTDIKKAGLIGRDIVGGWFKITPQG